ncbi:MAG: glycosyltransferase family 39 protein [Planctomycetes bacterium]|nr:glycosyltransferase family 39 protein [Planctomycetota bacterium]
MLALKLPGYHAQHIETDERIYWSLAENWIESRTYTLRGTEILDLLPPSMYDKPLFHHPPMLTFLLIPFASMEASQAAIAVSWIGHFAAVIGIALIAWAWRPAGRRSLDFLLWLPVLAMAVDPVFSFAGRKIWPDTLVGGFGAVAIGACALGIRSDRGGWLLAGGAFAAFAGLSKLTGLLIVPIGIIAILLSPGNARHRAARCLAFVAPCAVLMAPWFWMFFREYGQCLPAWIQPDAEVLAANPHLARAFGRPFGFYAYELLMASPVAGVCLAAACIGAGF